MTFHVAFIVNNYPPHVGGVERHVAGLAVRLVASGHRVTVVTLGGPAGDVVEDGVRVIRAAGWLPVGDVLSFPRPGATGRIARLLAGTGVTVISTHTRFFPMSALGLGVARRLGVPVVHTEHGSDFVRGVNPVVAIASRLVDVSVGRQVLRRAATVLAVSEQVAAFVLRLSGVRARVFPNAIDLDLWREARAAPRARLVYVGRLVPGKGWEEVLAAAAALRTGAGPAFELGMYGDGPDFDELRRQVGERDLGDIVTLYGQVGPEVLATGVAGAVLVNPTTLAEGFQTSLLEVVAAGGRVVTYDVAGAGVLAADGAPVRVVARSRDALAGAVAAELARPSDPYSIDRLAKWGWDERVTDYIRVVDRVADRADPRP